MVKNLPANARDAGDRGLIPGWGRSLEKGMATHSSNLAWEIPGTEEPGIYSPCSHKVRHGGTTAESKSQYYPLGILRKIGLTVTRKMRETLEFICKIRLGECE